MSDHETLEDERPRKALVLHPSLKSTHAKAKAADLRRRPEARLAEAVGLAAAIDLQPARADVVPVSTWRPATLIGPGKMEELAAWIAENPVDVVVVDAAVTPVQQRNLEKGLKAKVIDRTGLILEIFGARARTKEGRLQVELAHLNYQRSRLVRSWTHLERQRGGFGFLGGPGESQLEMDRRLIGDRIIRIKEDLAQVVNTRALHRRARQKVPYPVVALVGYTNAGKSTLFNRLTSADVMAKDLLFATLDPTMRTLRLPSGRNIILSDTVGFISELPTHLVAAFRATLEEVISADVILHVRDLSHPDTDAQAADVADVLASLGVAEDSRHRRLEAWNKADQLPAEMRETVQNQADRQDNAVLISALTGYGCDTLLERIDGMLDADRVEMDVTLDAGDGAAIAWLHRHGEVLEMTEEGGSLKLSVALSQAEAGKWLKRQETGRV
ncbi:GTPase HflX [Ferrovibrio terrae]|uniref:GTPase HflX n=1 Tax=Ferrovibrio terrae TaxID=2594003 RepID=A0A516H411_9PROT|nr:GTPase HflX [Ferrovibrio terrae]QDO98514.1 GTPase HflX [Ferrovibrio terrae]